MDLLSLLVFLVLVAVAYWVINALGLPPPVARVATIILVVVAVLVLLQALLGVNLRNFRLG